MRAASGEGEHGHDLEGFADAAETVPGSGSPQSKRREIGGPGGLEPTRYGDWERAGRCVDF